MPGAFELAVGQWAERQKIGVDKAVRQVVLTLAAEVVMRSPVDTGRFRGNWRVSAEFRQVGELEREDPSGQATMADIEKALVAGKFKRVWYITNNLPYAWKLETGHSKQAPLGIVALTALQFRSIVDDVARGYEIGALGIE